MAKDIKRPNPTKYRPGPGRLLWDSANGPAYRDRGSEELRYQSLYEELVRRARAAIANRVVRMKMREL